MEPPRNEFTIAAPERRIYKYVFGAVVGVLALAGSFVAYKLATTDPGAAACERLEEISRADPEGAKAVVDQLVDAVESSIVKGFEGEAVRVRGETNDERCRDAMRFRDKVMPHGVYTRFVDCIANAQSADEAGRCI